jgi:membrane protease YdiL (CAAX protease family)
VSRARADAASRRKVAARRVEVRSRPARGPSIRDRLARAWGSYVEQSLDRWNNAVLVVPLLVIYQIGILFTDGWRNGVDFVTPRLLAAVNGDLVKYLVFNGAVFVLAGFALFYRQAQRSLERSTLAVMVGESTVHAVAMGVSATHLLRGLGITPDLIMPGATRMPEFGLLDGVVMSIGAGVYEELVFRVVLLGGLMWLFRKQPRVLQVTIALLASSLVFSAAHLEGFGGLEPWTRYSFTYRLVLGLFLGLIYLTRGLAVAVYTHTFYDLLVLVPRALMGV